VLGKTQFATVFDRRFDLADAATIERKPSVTSDDREELNILPAN
ncbi:unnamed protein product, partial [Didymodactylos carnosus]